MTQVEWLKKQRARIGEFANKLSHSTMSSALSHDQYLINVGTFRAYRVMMQNFDALIDKIMGGDETGTEEPVDGIGVQTMDEEDDFDPPAPTRTPARRPTTRPRQPREWGG